MTLFVFIIFLCSVGWPSEQASSIEVSGAKIALPEGHVLGAAFYESAGMFFVQQSVLSTEDGGLKIRFRRQISSWSLKNQSIIGKRVFDENPPGGSAYPCGRIETSAKLHRVFICSAGYYIEVIDPDKLTTLGKMAQESAQKISDFAVDDLHSRLIVLGTGRDGSVLLTIFSLLNKDERQELELPIATARGMSLAVSSKTGQIGIALDISSNAGDKADVYACSAEPALTCTRVAKVDAVSQISFLGRQMLLATSTFADKRKDCIFTVDPAEKSVTREYCSPTGVHYAVGVVQQKYVVAFTGVSKRAWLSEENKSMTSSFSVWRAESSQVRAVANDPTDYGAFQNELRIVASSTEPFFLTFQRVSNMVSLYSINDQN